MKKIIALIMAVAMLCTALPLSVLADSINVNVNAADCEYYNLIEKDDYNLAPGAVESEYVIDNDDGSRRQVVHVIEVDHTNPNISVMPTYKNIDHGVDYSDENNWGTMGMSEQAAYIEENLDKNVVGAMNVSLSWSFTHPYGLLIYEGEVLYDCRSSCEACGNSGHPGGGYLVIYKDGRAELRDAKAELTGDEWMAQTICFSYLVKDGVSLYPTEDHTGTAAPRSVLGVKENGDLVMMMVDGRMAPYSTGFTNHEMAQVMLSLGCVDAINCDGGGSSTFITEREGTGELTAKSRYSDGAERATLTGIAVISAAVADGKFDHASVETEDKFVTPGSTVEFTATGADSAGGPAEIPENITWQLADSSMGTIDGGIFVSNGTTGTVTAQMVYEGAVVGESSINVVVPDSISFVQSNITVPYGKTVSLDIVAMYGVNEVALKDDDISFTLSDDAIGTISGYSITAGNDETITSGTITAAFKNTELSCTASVILGRASVVAYDFDDGTTQGFTYTVSNNAKQSISMYPVTEENGQVHSGTGAVALEFDCTQCLSAFSGGFIGNNFMNKNIAVDGGVKSVGFWFYVPEIEELPAASIRIFVKGVQTGKSANVYPFVEGNEWDYAGWHYYSLDLTSIGENSVIMFAIQMWSAAGYSGANTKYTYYVDEITIDYSEAVEDRENPVFDTINVSYEGLDNSLEMNGQTVNENTLAFTASVVDDTTKSNYTGLDISSAKAYIDGVEVTEGFSCSNSGFLSISDVTLSNGTHKVRFEISDNMGNKSYIEKMITIAGASTEDTINVVPADPDADRILIGSLYWVNIEATAIENVTEVKTVLNLNSLSTWELDHMEVAEGFEATYTIDSITNNATITITKTGNVSATGNAVLASLPIRTWESERVANGEYTVEELCAKSYYAHTNLMLNCNYGAVTFDDVVSTFSMSPIDVDTEIYANDAVLESWHTHTAVALDDKAATCTEDGYTGRTFCEECNSVVEWGTTIPAAGHTYEVIDGKYSCECGDVNAMTGLIKDGDVYRYIYNGTVRSGWFAINDEWYYFSSSTMAAVSGRNKVGGIYYDFEETGKLVSGVWAKNMTGTRYYYGPSYYYRGWYNIDGVDYYFKGGYRCENIDCQEGSGTTTVWYDFGPDGANATKLNGVFEVDGSLRYFEEGIAAEKYLVKVGNDYYYTTYNGYVAINKTVNTIATNCDLPKGTYTFGADGKMVGSSAEGEIVEIDGVSYYYVKGQGVEAGLINVDGDYYYAAYKGQLVVNKAINVKLTSCDLPAGTYEFGADGKVINGIIEKDGVLYYYENGQGVEKGLLLYEGDYYYSAYKGQLVVNKSLNISDTNCELPAGRYEFGADGKMLNGIVEKDGVLYYYENGQGVEKGLVCVDGDYYYAAYKGQLVVNKSLNVPMTSCDLPKDRYEFGADGKMLDGIVEKDGILYYYVCGKGTEAGLVCVDGDYYYAAYKGQLVVNKTLNIPMTSCDMPKDRYEFGADGKMIGSSATGEIVDKDGVLYYYISGKGVEAGLVCVDGDYYYAAYKGQLVVNKTLNVPMTSCDMPKDRYEFGADGKMIGSSATGEIVDKDGVLYYYISGKGVEAGLVCVDGEYYYAAYKGQVVVNKTLNVSITNCDLPKDRYEFGADGKMLNGIVEKDGVLYYYENGQGAEKGLFFYEGHYYYSVYKGQLVVSRDFNVNNANGLLIEQIYTFNELGQIVA